MILIHEAMNRGRTQAGWLDSFHTFAFGGFTDPARMGFGALRVVNEDRIAPGAGFARHPHADMDIITVPLAGVVRHEDSLGNVGEIRPGEVQLMRAGTGIEHEERNPSPDIAAHALQIWLIPDRPGGAPSYQQIALPTGGSGWTPIAAGDGSAPLRLGSDTRLSRATVAAGERLAVPTAPDRLTYVHLIEGLASAGGERLVGGDGLQIRGETMPDLEWHTEGAALLFDMAR